MKSQMHIMAAGLYNKALEQAQGRCLTGAKESLLSCISIEKDFIDARNLLGLIYWETGQVGQALKQWIISSSYEKEDNIAEKYLGLVDENQEVLAKYNEAISFYNKSLEYFHKDINDIATINLRKAVANNPNYVQARTLLGLYYAHNGEEEKARESLNGALKIDRDNYRANKYLQSLSIDIEAEEPAKTKAKTRPVRAPRPNTMIQNQSLGKSIIAFGVGAILMLGVYTVLVVPAKTSDFKEQVKIAQEEKESLEKDLQGALAKKDQEVQSLSQENAAMLESLSLLEEEQKTINQTNILTRAKDLAGERKWVDAAAKIESIDLEYLDGQIQEEYESLQEDVYKKAGEELYNEGFSEYRKTNLDPALELLEKSYKYAKEEYYSDNALFTIGRIYEDKGDMDTAQDYYKTVIEDYEGTDGAYNAQRRLN